MYKAQESNRSATQAVKIIYSLFVFLMLHISIIPICITFLPDYSEAKSWVMIFATYGCVRWERGR